MSTPRITCVVPVYNCERFVRAAVESVLEQTYGPLQVIAVDDGSTDGTPRELAAIGKSIRVIRQANAGHAAARNTGIRVAEGEFVAFLDADDLWHHEKLAIQVGRFEECPEIGVSFAHLVNFTGEAPDLQGPPPRAIPDAVPGYTSVTMLARRSLFSEIGLFDEALRHGNDRDWLLRAVEQGVRTDLLPDVLVYRRLHDANRSAALGASSRAEYVRIVKASLDRRRAQHGDAADIGLGGSSPLDKS